MGVFIVNTEAGVSAETGLSLPVFILLMIGAFFLIWNVYPKAEDWKKYLYIGLQIAGALILVYLAFVFRDGDGGVFRARWWGILGLIGWAYLVTAISYLLFRGKISIQVIVLALLTILCLTGLGRYLGIFRNVFGNGALASFSMAGLITTLIFLKYAKKVPILRLCLIMIGIGIVYMIIGLGIRPIWIISKPWGTPSWLFLCTGIVLIFYVFIYWLADIKEKGNYFKIIGPAGTATLTCYLIPYILYNASALLHFTLPGVLVECPLGLLKSILFAFLAIGITALLGKIHIKLKI